MKNIFKCQELLLIFILNENRLSSHMNHLSQHIISSNYNINTFDRMGKMIVGLYDEKGSSDNDYSPKCMDLKNKLLMIIVDSP